LISLTSEGGEHDRTWVEHNLAEPQTQATDLIGPDVDAVDQGGKEVAALRRGPPSSIRAGMPGRVPALPGFPHMATHRRMKSVDPACVSA